jgi:hypothetical protein
MNKRDVVFQNAHERLQQSELAAAQYQHIADMAMLIAEKMIDSGAFIMISEENTLILATSKHVNELH